MTCPFLREAQVKFCHASSVRKLIPMRFAPAGGGGAEEKCSSEAYLTCRVYQSLAMEGPAGGPCPCLGESLMQYCAAAPVAKLVPFSESLLSRCGNDSHRYCELYGAMAHPAAGGDEVDGIAMPAELSYAANHFWLEVGEDGQCHAGIDAFLSRALGKVERVQYVWQQGVHRPAAILTAGGVDWEVVFPNPLLLTGCNLYLRANPTRLNSEPYTAGWLFEGRVVEGTTDNLMQAAPARAWMERDVRRISESLQQGSGMSADGGLFAVGVLNSLERESRPALFHEFFSPFASGEEDV
jgi:glycine cleavage system H lipoate-binding protein